MMNLECLRALDLSHVKISELPGSIGNLKHLRHLNLEESDIEILPETICNLYQLKVLLLRGCRRLRGLPVDIKRLTKLRCLDVHMNGWHTVWMPRGIGRLTNLQALYVFNLGIDPEESGIEELGDLINLRGSLEIYNLGRVVNAENARVANLKSKINLCRLKLYWSDSWRKPSGPASLDEQEKVLESLQPHTGLIELGIFYYDGLAFPSWVFDPCFTKLVKIDLFLCREFTAFPPLGQLPFLKDLFLYGNHEVVVVGPEFRGQVDVAFPALEMLAIKDMSQWVDWHGVMKGDFPCLCELQIESCPVLQLMFPLYILHALEDLYICMCEQLLYIELWDPSSSCTPSSCPMGQPLLRTMNISGCPRACFFAEDDELQLFLPSTLEHLRIKDDCPLLVEQCQRDNGDVLSYIPEAKFWRRRDGGVFVSTETPQMWMGELQVDHIPVVENSREDIDDDDEFSCSDDLDEDETDEVDGRNLGYGSDSASDDEEEHAGVDKACSEEEKP